MNPRIRGPRFGEDSQSIGWKDQTKRCEQFECKLRTDSIDLTNETTNKKNDEDEDEFECLVRFIRTRRQTDESDSDNRCAQAHDVVRTCVSMCTHTDR